MKFSATDIDTLFQALACYYEEVRDNTTIQKSLQKRLLRKIEQAERAVEAIGTY